MLKIKIAEEASANFKAPAKGHEGDAGWDVFSPYDLVIHPSETVKIPLMFHIMGERGKFYKMEDKSSLASKGLLCHGGIIDNTYTGIVHAVITNISNVTKNLEKGQKIAQIIVQNCEDDAELQFHEGPLPETERGSGGFGSTGQQ